jgi:hypothetical protein
VNKNQGHGEGNIDSSSTATTAATTITHGQEWINIHGVAFRMRMFYPHTQMWEMSRANFMGCCHSFYTSMSHMLSMMTSEARGQYGIIVLIPYIHSQHNNNTADATSRTYWGHMPSLPHPTDIFCSMEEIDQYICTLAFRMGILRGGLPVPQPPPPVSQQRKRKRQRRMTDDDTDDGGDNMPPPPPPPPSPASVERFQ